MTDAITVADLTGRLARLRPYLARELVLEVISATRLTAAVGITASTLEALRCHDPIAALGFAVRECLADPEREFRGEQGEALQDRLLRVEALSSGSWVRTAYSCDFTGCRSQDTITRVEANGRARRTWCAQHAPEEARPLFGRSLVVDRAEQTTAERETAFLEGERRAYLHLLRTCASALGYSDPLSQVAALIAEREEAISVLREICAEHGDSEWSDKLHLRDILEKHLARHLGERHGDR